MILFTISKTETGFDAYYQNNGTIVAITTGDTLIQLKENALEAYNAHASENDLKLATLEDIKFIEYAQESN